MSGWRQFMAILRKDLIRELRTREMIISMILFVLLAMVIFHYAFGVHEDVDLTYFTGGMLWVTFIFAMLLGLNRSFAQEKDERCLDGLLLCPVDRVIIFLAKTAGNLIFLLIIQAVAVPVFTLFFVERSYAGDLPLFLAVLLLADLGICALGTLLATISMNTRVARPAAADHLPAADRAGAHRRDRGDHGHLRRGRHPRATWRRGCCSCSASTPSSWSRRTAPTTSP